MAEKKTAAAKTAEKKETAPKAVQSRVKAKNETEIVPFLRKKFG